MAKIQLGMRVKDQVTGFEGIASARTEYLYGCIRIAVQSTELKDGKPVDAQWFDEAQLSEVQKEIAPAITTTGGSGIIPPARDPQR